MSDNRNQTEFDRIIKELASEENRRRIVELENENAALSEASKGKDEAISQLKSELYKARMPPSPSMGPNITSPPSIEEDLPAFKERKISTIREIARAFANFFYWLYDHRPSLCWDGIVKEICVILLYAVLGLITIYWFIIRGV